MAADDSDRPYKVFSPTKVWMSADARGWAKEHGMSEQEFGKYLINQHQNSEEPFAGDVGSVVDVTLSDDLPE
jgi:hypothetical protein